MRRQSPGGPEVLVDPALVSLLEQHRKTLVQPRRHAARRDVLHERVGQFVHDDAIERRRVIEPAARYGGFDAVLRIARAVPLLWPLWIVASVPGIRQIGHAVYKRIATNRIRRGKCTDEFCVP